MASQKTQEVICMLSQVAGGAGAGFLDVKFANKMPAGLPLGVWVGAGLGAAGLFGRGKLPGKVADFCLDAGGGMLAFEAGTIVAQKTLKSMLPAQQTSGTSAFGVPPGVGRLPAGRPITSSQIMGELNALENMYR